MQISWGQKRPMQQKRPMHVARAINIANKTTNEDARQIVPAKWKRGRAHTLTHRRTVVVADGVFGVVVGVVTIQARVVVAAERALEGVAGRWPVGVEHLHKFAHRNKKQEPGNH